MKIIETDGIPPQILNAMQAKINTYRDDKTAYMQNHDVDNEFSVTTLAKSPRQHQLVVRHWREIEVKAMDLYYVLMGSVIHAILEQHPNPGDKVEYRYGKTFTVNGKKVHIHGMADTVNMMSDAYRSVSEGCIEDWKYTSMAAMNYSKDDYVQQLNFLRLLTGKERDVIKSIRNIYLFRDWRSSDVKAGRSPQPLFCKVVEQPIWSDEEVKERLKNRIIAHTLAIDIPDNDLPECTKEELWYSRSGYRIRKKTQKGEWSKVSSGWEETEELAHKTAKEKALKEYRLEPTHGTPKRCQWCDAAPFCSQKKKLDLQLQGEFDSDEETSLE